MTSSPTVRGPVRAAGWVLAVVVGCLLWAVVTAAPSYAHDQLRSTNPADGAVLEQAPPQLELTYNADVLPIAPMVVLRDAAGTDVPVAEPVVNGASVTLPWPQQAPAGDYDVVWRVVSSDGHPIQGTFAFTVQTAAPAGSGVASSDPAASDPAVSEPVTTPSASATATPSTETTPTAAAPAAGTDESGSGPSTAVIAGGALLLVLVVAALLVLRRRRAARTHGS